MSNEFHIWCLDDPEQLMVNNGEDQGDLLLLVDLIKRMLHLDPEQRIKPLEVLQHPFFTHWEECKRHFNRCFQKKTSKPVLMWVFFSAPVYNLFLSKYKVNTTKNFNICSLINISVLFLSIFYFCGLVKSIINWKKCHSVRMYAFEENRDVMLGKRPWEVKLSIHCTILACFWPDFWIAEARRMWMHIFLCRAANRNTGSLKWPMIGQKVSVTVFIFKRHFWTEPRRGANF